jgi:hypothetical protein
MDHLDVARRPVRGARVRWTGPATHDGVARFVVAAAGLSALGWAFGYGLGLLMQALDWAIVL